MVPSERSCHTEYSCKIYESHITSSLKFMTKVKVFKSRSNSKVKICDLMARSINTKL